MGKAIIYLFFILVFSSLVISANYEFLYSPYTAKLDRTLSLNQTGNNLTVDYLFGNVPWNNLTDYPVACPANTYLTQLNDSVTCTAVSQIDNDLYINGSLDVDEIINIPTTTATTGQITQNGERILHSLGTQNFFIGTNAGNLALTGINNVGIGHQALDALTTGESNMAMGLNALGATTTGLRNMGIGSGALQANINGSDNVALGQQALSHSISAINNVAVGTNALWTTTTVGGNVAIGFNALWLMNDGGIGANVAVGYRTLADNTSGAKNTCVGREAGHNITTGSNNTIIGFQAGSNLVTDSGSVMIGQLAGYYETEGNKLFIDNTNRASEADARIKSLIYGVFAAAVADQILTVNAKLNVNGNVGIGTSSPAGALDVTSTTAGFIVPRMTTAQVAALTPVNGMIVYDSTLNKFQFYENGAWVSGSGLA